jgi:hypothetical protein
MRLVSIVKKTTTENDLNVRRESDCVSSLHDEEHEVLTLAWEERPIGAFLRKHKELNRERHHHLCHGLRCNRNACDKISRCLFLTRL